MMNTLLILIALGTPQPPRHHIMWYPTTSPDDVAMVYLRIDQWTQRTEVYGEMVGEMLTYDVPGTFDFIVKHWLNQDNPFRPMVNMQYFSTFARFYKGGLEPQRDIDKAAAIAELWVKGAVYE